MTWVAVVKSVPLERVREAVAFGIRDLGENRVQEASVAVATLGSGVRWHMIGHLQRNKAARAAALFDRVHSVDSWELAAALSRAACALGRTLSVLVQVNVGEEGQKHGVATSDAAREVQAIAGLSGLALDGVMSIGPRVETAEGARGTFSATRELRDRVERETGVELPHLSMGMSGDFEVAIEEGATFVRIGTALFGERHARA